MTFLFLTTSFLSTVGILLGWGLALFRHRGGIVASGVVLAAFVTAIFLPLVAHYSDVPWSAMPVNDIPRETVASFLRPFQTATGPMLVILLLLTLIGAWYFPLVAAALPLLSFTLYYKVCLPLINRGRDVGETLMLDNVPLIWVFMFSFSGSALLLAYALVLRALRRRGLVLA